MVCDGRVCLCVWRIYRPVCGCVFASTRRSYERTGATRPRRSIDARSRAGVVCAARHAHLMPHTTTHTRRSIQQIEINAAAGRAAAGRGTRRDAVTPTGATATVYCAGAGRGAVR